ncbi:MAG TPA: hypothetical protein VNU28_02405 [Solirubrobacteraceae bacterium]|nr:hypothetical protein [Solirubrobacteraceae bacterium]
MAPASASPQPPSDRSDIAQSAEHSQHRQAGTQHEVYGLLDIERHVKDDGRGLILYARREREHEGQ